MMGNLSDRGLENTGAFWGLQPIDGWLFGRKNQTKTHFKQPKRVVFRRKNETAVKHAGFMLDIKTPGGFMAPVSCVL